MNVSSFIFFYRKYPRDLRVYIDIKKGCKDKMGII
jgi:hypothetical protein